MFYSFCGQVMVCVLPGLCMHLDDSFCFIEREAPGKALGGFSFPFSRECMKQGCFCFYFYEQMAAISITEKRQKG